MLIGMFIISQYRRIFKIVYKDSIWQSIFIVINVPIKTKKQWIWKIWIHCFSLV